jgi:hypothetical protein
MGRRFKLIDRRMIDIGPVVAKRPSATEKKRLTIEGHPKFIHKNLPPEAWDYYEIEIDSTFKKPKGPTKRGDVPRAIVDYARRKMKEGMTAKQAAAATVEFLKAGLRQRGKDDSLKLFDRTKKTKHRVIDKPGQGLYRHLCSELRKKRADRSPPAK